MRQKQIRDYVLEARLRKEKCLNRKFESSQKNEMNYKTAKDYVKAARQAMGIIEDFIEDEEDTAKAEGYTGAELREVQQRIKKLEDAVDTLEWYEKLK